MEYISIYILISEGISMDLKDRIALARKQAGLSQEQLGEKLGVSRQAVSKWESGQANPDVAYVTEMCRLFGVSSDWLLMGLDEGDQGSPAACPGCGGIVTPLDRFCPKCGQPLTSGQENSGYTLLLADSGEFGYQTYLAVSRLSGRPYAREGFPLVQAVERRGGAPHCQRSSRYPVSGAHL